MPRKIQPIIIQWEWRVEVVNLNGSVMPALADGESHGYGIMREVEERTNGKVTIWPATLYGAIKRMLAAELIEVAPERPDPDMDDQRRRYYRLSDKGREVLAGETARLAQIVELAREKDVLGTPRPAS